MINDIDVMILLVKGEQVDVDGLCFMKIKYSFSLCQYYGNKGVNQLKGIHHEGG